MQFLHRFTLVSILFLVLVLSTSWGFLVHKTVNQLAVYELPVGMSPFFYQNMEYLVVNAPRPDVRRNQDSTEAPKHFIDLEDYHMDMNKIPREWSAAVKMFGMDSLKKWGYVPFEVVYIKNKLTTAFKSGNKDSILFYAADLGHYIGDANVPLHTTNNYDGQLTNQKGLHSLWESMIPELELGNYQLNSLHKATYLKQPVQVIWEAINRSSKLVPIMLQKEREVSAQFTEEQKFRVQIRRGRESKSYTTAFAKAYAVALTSSINEQLLSSADLIADFWYTSWVDAGKPDLSAITPGWENKLLLAKKPETKEGD